MPLEFEWDLNKNKKNVSVHGIDFHDGWQIFEKPMLSKIDDRKDYGEQRLISLGQLDNVVVVLVYTIRSNKIRIISIRRANHDERQTYQEKFKK